MMLMTKSYSLCETLVRLRSVTAKTSDQITTNSYYIQVISHELTLSPVSSQ